MEEILTMEYLNKLTIKYLEEEFSLKDIIIGMIIGYITFFIIL